MKTEVPQSRRQARESEQRHLLQAQGVGVAGESVDWGSHSGGEHEAAHYGRQAQVNCACFPSSCGSLVSHRRILPIPASLPLLFLSISFYLLPLSFFCNFCPLKSIFVLST